ncbi:uncharacterized protein RJT20DRAFT_128393 [Scheffersomyces xylosifermentans]|uniref:uncharacterized protein n=1 Tax=Scheffersomyces xylosifermentans TaxID=1304137 RepID=UPI00315CB4F7
MVSIINLPHEVVVKIFKNLTPGETSSVIDKLKSDDTNHTRYVDLLIRLLYQRLFNGKLMIINEEPNQSFEYDTLLTIDSFEERFAVENYENLLFQEIRPNYVEIKFTRQVNDYNNFINNLYKFYNLLSRSDDEEDVRLLKYFETKILQLNFYTDGNLVLIENPTSLSTIIIKILINLANNKNLTFKMMQFTIKSTDVGKLYISQWSQLLKKFVNLEMLDLSNNIICSDYEESTDVIATSFKLPLKLKTLILDHNVLRYVSRAMIQNLPKTLEVLSLNNNKITRVEYFPMAVELPNLRSLRLNFNTRLAHLDPKIFEDHGNKTFTLQVRGTCLDDITIQRLRRVAKAHNFWLHV